MGHKHQSLVHLAQSLAVLAIVAFTASCWRSEAAAPAPPMYVAMQAVHDYGSGHQPTPLKPPKPIPQQTEEQYQTGVRQAMLASDFDQLEKMAAENRAQRGLTLGGNWNTNAFYNQVGVTNTLNDNPTDAEYQAQLARLNKWLSAKPDSAAAHIALANFYLNYAFFARGEGTADTVSNIGWRLYNDRNIAAEQYLLSAVRLKERDPGWYEAMLVVGFQSGWDHESETEILNRAVAFEPGYYHYYRRYAEYLKPQWYGQTGEIEKYAEQASLQLPDPDGSILYFRVTSSLACNCREQLADLPGVSLAKFASGYDGVTHFYGKSNLNANRLAFVAYKFGDKGIAQEAFESVDHMEKDVWWNPQIYADARQWAYSPN